MALIPADKTEPHEIAQLDLPLPRTFEDDDDVIDWQTYTREIPPSVLLRKTAEAVDAWVRQAPRAVNAAHMSEDDKIEWITCREVVQTLCFEAERRFGYDQEDSINDAYLSELDRALFFIEDFLDQTGSPEAGAWRQRRRHVNAVSDATVDQLVLDATDIIEARRDKNFQSKQGSSSAPYGSNDPDDNWYYLTGPRPPAPQP